MKAVKAIYEKGTIKLSEEPVEAGPLEVLVVFPEPANEPWEEILNEPTPRPSFLKFAEACEAEIREGKSVPLKLEEL